MTFYTVRLKYDVTHSDQKFYKDESYPLIAWKRPRNAYEVPAKRLLIARKRPLGARDRVNFQRISGQNGCHGI